MVHQLLQQWGRQGLEAYVQQLQQRYARTAAVAEAAAAKHLGDIAEWQPIRAGMFMWVKIKGEGLGLEGNVRPYQACTPVHTFCIVRTFFCSHLS
jgi:DNA-binding transcriptional MocR family regulator